MDIFFSHRDRPSEFFGAAEEVRAQNDGTHPELKIGRGLVFLQVMDYDITGYSFTPDELRALADRADGKA